METNLEFDLSEEYQINKELIYIKLQNCIDKMNIAEGRPIVEKYLSVAQTDTKFIALAKQLKACERHSSDTSSDHSKSNTHTLCTEYSLRRKQILEDLQNIINDKTYSCADSIIQKYHPVANHDEDFLKLTKQIRTLQAEERASCYANALEALPTNDISNRLQLLSDIVTILPNEKNVETLNNYIINTISSNICSPPSASDIKDLCKALNLLPSENTFEKRAKLCQRLLSFHDKFNLERIRCQQAAEKLENYKSILLTTDKNNYQECIRIYQAILAVYQNYRNSAGLSEAIITEDEKRYSNILQEYLTIEQKLKTEQQLEIKKEFDENKSTILQNIQRSLVKKQYDETVNKMERYHAIAKDDPDFCIIVNNTRTVAKALRRTRLEGELNTM